MPRSAAGKKRRHEELRGRERGAQKWRRDHHEDHEEEEEEEEEKIEDIVREKFDGDAHRAFFSMIKSGKDGGGGGGERRRRRVRIGRG